MKYIRTKDGIYVCPPVNTITKIYELPKGIQPLRYANGTLEQVGDRYVTINGKDYKIIDNNTADTIEELCDDFVVAYEDGARIVYGDLEWAKTKAKASLEFGNKSVIYGAIWTDKGLIYVAKMNEKGELELL